MVNYEEIAKYMIDNKTTIREAAKHFGVGKSTLHTALSEKLIHLNKSLYKEVRKLLKANWEDRQHRGGIASSKQRKVIT